MRSLTSVSPLQWWLGVAALCGAIVFHGLGPRYHVSVVQNVLVREDRWLGTIEVSNPKGTPASWVRLATPPQQGQFSASDIVPDAPKPRQMVVPLSDLLPDAPAQPAQLAPRP